jgi:uncharacterized membrane protein YdcZ (DUF606 family)
MMIFVVCGLICAGLVVANIGLARTNMRMRKPGMALLCSFVSGLSGVVVAYCLWRLVA